MPAAAPLLAALLLALRAFSAPVPIIFDTDMDTDCDDAGALAVLHVLADRGECEILATMVSVGHPWSAPTVAAINAYYGRPHLPVGQAKAGGVDEPSRFAKRIAEEFPQPIKSADDAPDALELYRDLLAKQPDGSVVIVTVGYLRNLRNLLESPGGPELVRRKVKTYVCMGGNFIGAPAHDDLKLGNVNFQRDPESAHHVVWNWPTPIVFAGREVCSVPSGLTCGTSLARTPTNNPVRRAYEHYFGGTLKNRHVADLVTVLYAVRGLRDYWDIHAGGHMDLQADMKFTWRDAPDRQQSYLLKRQVNGQPNDRAIEAVLDDLLTQAPRGAR
jgi:inosine-uridine nucleoside N-ribohydrolase